MWGPGQVCVCVRGRAGPRCVCAGGCRSPTTATTKYMTPQGRPGLKTEPYLTVDADKSIPHVEGAVQEGAGLLVPSRDPANTTAECDTIQQNKNLTALTTKQQRHTTQNRHTVHGGTEL